MAYLWGGNCWNWLSWQSLNMLGIFLGAALPARWGLEFAGTLALLAVTLLCGASTAITGPIGFVGLMIPHVARWIAGQDQRWIMAFTLVLSPTLLLLADIAGRFLLTNELRVSIVTALIGAPVMIWLVRQQRRF